MKNRRIEWASGEVDQASESSYQMINPDVWGIMTMHTRYPHIWTLATYEVWDDDV